MKKALSSERAFIVCGAPGWIRTSGTQLRRLVRYPLSYGRKIVDTLKDLLFQVKQSLGRFVIPRSAARHATLDLLKVES
jgi:hypothetical protein